jgi:hypothetical protein
MNTAISIDSVEPLVSQFGAVTAWTSQYVTRVAAGPLEVTLRHDHPQWGNDVLRGLWPPHSETPAAGPIDVIGLAASDPRVTSLIPPAPHGVPRLYVPEEFTGQRWQFDWTNGLHTGFDLHRRAALVIWQDSAYNLLVSSPLRTILQWLASDTGGVLLHAAAVGRPDGGILLLGPGRAGKSTTAMAVMAAGGVAAGDDYVWVDPASSPPVAHSCFRTARTRQSNVLSPLGARSEVPGFDIDYDEPKRVLYLAEATNAMVRQLPIVGAAAIRKGGDTTEVRSIPAIEALLKVAPSSIFQASSDRPRQMSQITGLISGLPCYEVTVSRDLDEVGHTLLSLVDSLVSPRGDQ